MDITQLFKTANWDKQEEIMSKLGAIDIVGFSEVFKGLMVVTEHPKDEDLTIIFKANPQFVKLFVVKGKDKDTKVLEGSGDYDAVGIKYYSAYPTTADLLNAIFILERMMGLPL